MKKLIALILSCILLISFLSIPIYALDKKELPDDKWIAGICFLYDDRGIFLDQETLDYVNENRCGIIKLPYGINGEKAREHFPILNIKTDEEIFVSFTGMYSKDGNYFRVHIDCGDKIEKRHYDFALVYDENLEINSYETFAYNPNLTIEYCLFAFDGAAFTLSNQEIEMLNSKKNIYITDEDIKNYDQVISFYDQVKNLSHGSHSAQVNKYGDFDCSWTTSDQQEFNLHINYVPQWIQALCNLISNKKISDIFIRIISFILNF